MRNLILIKDIEVTNANAVSGFTWGFPAPTHFLGFVNALRLKLNPSLTGQDNGNKETDYSDVKLKGCAIFSHRYQVHTYQPYTDDAKQYLDEVQFSQKRGTRYMLFQDKRAETPPMIEEAKMNLTVSLLIEYEGYVADEEVFTKYIHECCYSLRLAGGSIFQITEVVPFHLEDMKSLVNLKRHLLPAFMLKDRTDALQAHYETIKQIDSSKQIYDAWLDFCTFKQASRPKHSLLTKFIKKFNAHHQDSNVMDIWHKHLAQPYREDNIPSEISELFSKSELNDELKSQLENYMYPNENTEVVWEYVPKPTTGYLVPIMCGYHALSPIYDNAEIADTRDDKTPVRFVESIHTIGEWQSVHRLNKISDIYDNLWQYYYDDGWYLCVQSDSTSSDNIPDDHIESVNPDDLMN